MPRWAIHTIAVAAFVAGVGAQSTERVDIAAIARIRDEGLNRSQIMETMFWLTDRYGPRLMGSPWYDEAGDWAVTQLRDWGMANAHKDRFPFGRGWTLVNFHATMTEPRVMPIIGAVKAWTPGTNGVHTAEVVRPNITSEADAEPYRGKLRGRIVLTQPARDVRMLDDGDGTVLRYADQDGKWMKEALATPEPSAPRAGGAAGRGAGRGGRGRGDAGGFNLNQFYKDEGVLALFDRGSNSDMASGGSGLSWQQQHVDGGTFAVQSGGSARNPPDAVLPQVTLAVEHYNRMVRLLDHDVPVKVELDIETQSVEETPDAPRGFNVIAEIPGTDKADEIVLIGAHFDSWQGATGATDNAAGSAAMMEVMRILTATGLKPRRTIRLALWGGEETGFNGSSDYAREHLGTADQPKPEMGKLVAYYNLDNGTGRIRGIWMQGNPAVAPIFAAWIAPLKDLGVEILSPRSVGSTDHSTFDRLGVPAFQFVQERYEYNSRTHHTNMDFLDRVQPADMKQIAAVAAVFAWQTANRDQPLPRK